MLKLINITKEYVTGNSTVHALRGVSLEFRKSEFVSILGQSGCGKTTLLNIIGGLDRYTDGDLIINGKSTKTFKDGDWDSYRNHSIGFVFQSYNLIPHQSVLSNVELALTLSGVSKSERRRRAIEALEKVGLGDQIHKKPNQMSGGQMQRVAIARALVNDPDILLADEPTGALDTSTSVQIMELLKEVASDRLVIMVTHNPELAETYSTRIIKLLDGLVVDDSAPYTSVVEDAERKACNTDKKTAKKKDIKQKTSMSFFTALSLSFNNLRTKKGRTIMTSFAGSIGIIGIALILALSTGINAFIAQVQEDTLSTYPLTIQKHTQDMSAMLSAMTSVSDGKDYSDSNQIHVDDSLGTMISAMSSTVENNLEKFKEHLDKNNDDIKDYVSDIQYTYDYNLQIYSADGKVKVGMETVFEHMGDAFSSMSDLMEMGGGIDVFSEMINNQDILDQQYEVIAGNWPSSGAADEVVLVVNSNNQISKMTLYMLGILDPNDIDQEMKDLIDGKYESKNIEPFSYDYFLGLKFKLLTTSDFFEKTSKTYSVSGKDYAVWSDVREIPGYDQEGYVKDNGVDVKIVGIVRPKDGAAATSIAGAVGYTKALTDYILDKNSKSEVINQQKATPSTNVLTGLAFERTKYTPETIGELIDKIDTATMDMFYAYMTEQILSNPEFSDRIQVTDKTSFIGMSMLLPNEKQAEILGTVLSAAQKDPQNAMGISTICSIVSSTTGGSITVTPENFTTLIPVLSKAAVPLAYNGIDGITDIIGDEEMSKIYEKINQDQPILTATEKVTKENFLQTLMTLSVMDSAYQSEILELLVNKAILINKESVDDLCAMLSQSAGAEVSADNLASLLPTLQPMALFMSIDGISGLVELAGQEEMKVIYTQLTESIKTMTVNDEIFEALLVTLDPNDQAFIELEETLYNMAPQIDATYDSVLKTLDDAEKASPASVNFYAKDFESKEAIETFIADYNEKAEEKDKLEYTDLVGALMSSVTIIVNAISYVLIAFVAISLVVSSIMIGIITNISVLERTKEIGILRAVGASKRDISRVFNAETLIIGLAAGAIGIIMTVLLCFPITAIVQYFTGLDNIRAVLPVEAGFILVAISMILTLVAGIIPSRSAAKKDPVIALRSE